MVVNIKFSQVDVSVFFAPEGSCRNFFTSGQFRSDIFRGAVFSSFPYHSSQPHFDFFLLRLVSVEF